jgi:TIR domain
LRAGSLPFLAIHSDNLAQRIAYRMKVFLSHSTKDKQFVQTLAAELETEKIEPWICEVDVEFGGNFVAKIEEGLRDADLTVLFWSPEAARSDWTRLEWTSVTAREISESRTRLGVVLLRDCAIPELLRVKHRIDAAGDRGVDQAPSRHAPLSGDKSGWRLSPASTARFRRPDRGA